MKNNPDNLRIKVHAGFTLVEVMVGMVITLLGVIIIFQVFSVSEGVKRTTTSGGDAMQNGGSAMYMLESSFRHAGYGFFSGTILPLGGILQPDPPAATKLVEISAGAGNVPDSFILRYRDNWEFGKFQPDPGNFTSPAIVPPPITMETISVNVQAQLQSVKNGTQTVIADGIVMLRVEYGVDANGDGAVDTWTRIPPANPQDVWAVRYAVVARSAQPEKPSTGAGTACDTTQAAPTWIGSTPVAGSHPTTALLDLTGNIGLDTTGSQGVNEWMCYRYKTFENTVALRN